MVECDCDIAPVQTVEDIVTYLCYSGNRGLITTYRNCMSLFDSGLFKQW